MITPPTRASSDYFDVAAVAFKKYFPDPSSLTINTDAHVNPTYVATTQSSDEPFILQFRPHKHALVDSWTYEAVKKVLGDSVPSITLLGEHEHNGKKFLVYAQSRLPGEPIARLFNKTDVLPAAAEGVGRLLAKCAIPHTSCGTDRARWFEKLMSKLERAHSLSLTDPSLEQYKVDIVEVLDAVAAGGLDELPLAYSNGDMNALNILATKDGEIGGVVDWDAAVFEEQPLGMWLSVVMWLKCLPRLSGYEEYENTAEIGQRFWKGFLSSVPPEVARQREALSLAMKLGAILYDMGDWGEDSQHLPHLRAQLDYIIPEVETGME